MRTAAAATAAIFLLLFFLTTFFESPLAHQKALKYFSEEEIRNGREYSHQRKTLFWSRQAVLLLFLGTLVLSGGGRRLADACAAWTGGYWIPTLLLTAGAVFLAEQLLTFPASVVGGWVLPRSWDLASPTYTFTDWLTDYGKSVGLSAGIGAVVLVGFYGLMRLFPDTWWLAAAGGSAGLGIIFAYLLPVLVEPMFNTFTPLKDTKWAALQPRVEALARKAGLTVGEVLVSDAGRRSRHTNAYFSGFGSTQRIVLYDTLLEGHTADEIESVLAHEIGHWRHGHILQGIALGSAGALLAFFVLSKVLAWAAAQPSPVLTGPTDPAGYPLIVLLALLGGWVAAPVENAISRHMERQADEASLELAGKPEVFIEAEKKLAVDNVSNVTPNPIATIFFAGHPSAVERIEMAERYLPTPPAGVAPAPR